MLGCEGDAVVCEMFFMSKPVTSIGAAFPVPAECDQRQGLVVLTVTSQLFAHTSYWASVALVNPMTARQGLMLSQSYMWADGNCPDSSLILTHDNPSHVAVQR